MRDTPWMVRNGKPFLPADCLAKGGNAVSCGIKRSQVLADRNQTPRFRRSVPPCFGCSTSATRCADRTFAGPSPRNVLIYHDAHHLSATYMRTMTPELGRQLSAATGWW